MRGLTIDPHFAAAIAHLQKGCENRTKPIPPALVGQRVAIHAGATLPKTWATELQAAAPRPIVWRECADHGWDVAYADGPWGIITTRAIVATAVLGWCRESVAGLPRPPPWSDPEAEWWWRLDDVRRLTTPVPCPRGQLGLWHLDRKYPGLTAQVEAAPWVAA